MRWGRRTLQQTGAPSIFRCRVWALSSDDERKGRMKMSADIAKSIFRNLATEGLVRSDALFKTLTIRYLRVAQDAVDRDCNRK
jgi:glucosyl-3-phosphoglycerate synthase